jgi:hypothetical protein
VHARFGRPQGAAAFERSETTEVSGEALNPLQ